jgi:hypothetical protein
MSQAHLRLCLSASTQQLCIPCTREVVALPPILLFPCLKGISSNMVAATRTAPSEAHPPLGPRSPPSSETHGHGRPPAHAVSSTPQRGRGLPHCVLPPRCGGGSHNLSCTRPPWCGSGGRDLLHLDTVVAVATSHTSTQRRLGWWFHPTGNAPMSHKSVTRAWLLRNEVKWRFSRAMRERDIAMRERDFCITWARLPSGLMTQTRGVVAQERNRDLRPPSQTRPWCTNEMLDNFCS